jgi:hypothetical protein
MGKIESEAGSSQPPPGYDPSPSYDAEASTPQVDSEVQPPPIGYSIFPKDIVMYRAEYISLIMYVDLTFEGPLGRTRLRIGRLLSPE